MLRIEFRLLIASSLLVALASCSRPQGSAPPASNTVPVAKSASRAAEPAGDVQLSVAASADDKKSTNPPRGEEKRSEMVPGSEVKTSAVVEAERPRPTPPPKLPPPEGATRLDPDSDAWLDTKERAVIVDGNISLREGMLEMFACLRGTKEHESIISANTRAFVVHAALVGLGADPGTPVEWRPTYKPPTGPEIEILVQWIDEDGNEETARAQDLVKDIRTQKPMTHPFVFAGSLFWKDPEDGRTYYMAENGDFICVSNFGTAMLDIPVESSQSNEQLGFIALTERIPPLGTPVRMILKPKVEPTGETKSDKRDGPQ